ncbi:transmembrane adaptor Erv26-domain-containing protein [Mucor mucedo]|uniref:transmembrane adaptor Erv26-domain-containing protein n=1 Tax=Mucor mucedo TaxID=29922 RepID=UPI002220EC6F|nr:transmembrane adaptor Erv26-domain-containing protein [Mucor mucedo]KAI7892460.1 transmembrane adaptor Erv26-domain-containing protein [Mucor mucedo]
MFSVLHLVAYGATGLAFCFVILSLAFSILCHLVYSLNLETFPFISLTSVPFIGSCILVFANHFLWFRYFTSHYRPFMDIAAFFGLCVWLVPFAYFISLSANDNALPTSDPAFDAIPNQQKQGLMKTMLSYVGIKAQETTSLDTSFVPPPAPVVNPAYSGYTSSTSSQYMAPNRDLQNRKAA